VGGGIRETLGQHLWRQQPCAVIEWLDCWLLLMTPPYPQQVRAPLRRIAGVQRILALSKWHTRPFEPGFQLIAFYRLPSPEVHGRVGLIITVMEIDQMVGPDITSLRVIIHIGDLVTVLPIMRQSRLIETQHAFQLHLGS
jgi:hypothetical protein